MQTLRDIRHSLFPSFSTSQPLFLLLFFLLLIFAHRASSLPQQSRADQDVAFEFTVPMNEKVTADATSRYPVDVTEINTNSIGDELSQATDIEFQLMNIDPDIETDHFLMKASGPKAVKLEIVKPFDREQMVRDFPDKIEIEDDGEESAMVRLWIGARVKGSTGDWTYQIVNIKIQDANDEAPVFDDSELTRTLDENRAPRAVNPLMNVRAVDKDTGDNGRVKYQRGDVTSFGVDGKEEVKLDAGSWFTVHANNGQINVQQQIDREAIEKFTIGIIAIDEGRHPNSVTATVTILINDVNDNPPRCEQTTCEVSEDAAESTQLSSCIIQCEDADVGQSFHNEISLSADAGSTCPFKADVKGRVTMTSSLDREKERQHSCVVKVVDPGKPDFSSSTKFVVKVMDINDCAPKLKDESLMLTNTVNDTVAIEFVDEDEGQTVIDVMMTEGAEYFALPEVADDEDAAGNDLRRHRRSSSRRRHELRQSLPAASPIFILRQAKKLPMDLAGLMFRACDAASNCGKYELPVTFPGQFTQTAGGAFPWWIILVVVAICLIILVFALVFKRRRKAAAAEYKFRATTTMSEIEKYSSRRNDDSGTVGPGEIAVKKAVVIASIVTCTVTWEKDTQANVLLR